MIEGLRAYAAYKDAGVPWLDRVPDHWSVTRARNLLREVDVRSKTGAETHLSMSQRLGLVPSSEIEERRLVSESYVGAKLCVAGDLVLNRLKAHLGVFARASQPGLVSPDYTVLRRVSDDVAIAFLEYVLRSSPCRAELRTRAKGLVEGFWRLYTDDFYQIKLPAPPTSEQNTIVRFLDHADRQIRRYIRAKKKLITLLNEQKQAIVHRTVTRGLDVKAPTKPSCIEWLGNVPQDWRRVRLKQVATVQTGITLGKVYGDTALIERPYLRVANVQSGRVELSKITTVRLPPAEAAGATLVAGDVLMTEGGDIDKLGRGCVWRGEISECLHQNHVFAVRTDARTLLPEFLVAVMGSRHGRAYFQTTAKQTTNLAATNSTTLGNMPLWLPATDVQQQILDWVAVNTAEIDGATARALREVGLLQQYRSRLVADVVTGKIDVREAAAHLPDAPTTLEDERYLTEDTAESDSTELDGDAEPGMRDEETLA